MSAKDCPIGTRVFTVGYPLPGFLDQSPKYTSGDLSSLSAYDGEDTGLMLVTCPIQGGNSGGALVSENGQVVGTICLTNQTARMVNFLKGHLPQGLNFAIRIEYLRKLAERNSVRIPSPALRVVDPPKVITANSVQIINWQ